MLGSYGVGKCLFSDYKKVSKQTHQNGTKGCAVVSRVGKILKTLARNEIQNSSKPTKVQHDPNFAFSLIFARQMVDNGLDIEFVGGKCTVKKSDSIVANSRGTEKLYVLHKF